MDEISISAKTKVAELKDGEVSSYSLSPTDFGMELADLKTLKVDSVEQSLAMIQATLGNTPGPALDIVCLNAGAAIYVSGVAETMAAGVDKARSAIADGKGSEVLSNLVAKSNT